MTQAGILVILLELIVIRTSMPCFICKVHIDHTCRNVLKVPYYNEFTYMDLIVIRINLKACPSLYFRRICDYLLNIGLP